MNPEDFVDIPQECCLADERVLVAFYDRIRTSKKAPGVEFRTRWSLYSDGWIIRSSDRRVRDGDWEQHNPDQPEQRVKAERPLRHVIEFIRTETEWPVTVVRPDLLERPRA